MSSQLWSIREATERDHEDLCELFREVDFLHAEALPHVFRVPEPPARTIPFLSDILANENAALLVAEQDGAVIGLTHVHILSSPDRPAAVPRRYGVIEIVAVAEGFRRQGIGKALLDRAERWILGRGTNEIQLGVWEFNANARALYEQLGYETAVRRLWKRVDSRKEEEKR